MKIALPGRFFILPFLLMPISGWAQTVDTAWTRTYGGDYSDYATSLIHTDDGGYLMTGITYSYGAGDKDVYLVKTDSAGDTLWTKVYGDTLIDNVFSIRSTSDNGYVIGGWSSSRSGDNRDFDCYIVKLDHDGELEWENYCTDSSNCGAYDLVQADDGGYVLAGAAKLLNQTYNFDLFVVRADQYGDTIWTRHYMVPGRELWDGLAYSIAKADDNCYVVAGEINFRRENQSDIYVIKIDDNGDTLWTKIIDLNLLEYAWDCITTPEGDIVITGWTWGGFADTAGDEIYLAKLNRCGDLLWQKTFAYDWPVSSYNDGWAVALDPADNGYLIAADTRPLPVSPRDIYILKTDCDGDQLWSMKIGGYRDESPFNIIAADDNGFAVCGQKEMENSTGNLYKDFYLMKFETVTRIEQADQLPTASLVSCRNYPNPFNVRTTISYSLQTAADVAIDIFDIQGRKVASLMKYHHQPGNYRITWIAEDIPSGVFFYRLQAGNCSETGKMVLLK
jgi:hypothetical protein